MQLGTGLSKSHVSVFPVFSGLLPLLTSYKFLTPISFLVFALSVQVPQLLGTSFCTQSIHFGVWTRVLPLNYVLCVGVLDLSGESAALGDISL